MYTLYGDSLRRLLRQGVLRADSRILVVAGGSYDRDTLSACGFTNVTISNCDEAINEGDVAPYVWSRQDAEALDFADESFDFVVIHAGLHHCRRPHRALLEVYRVARIGLLAIDPLDCVAARVGVRLGLGQEYEVAAVAGGQYSAGGVNNSAIPNRVYRWTRREVEKTILSYAPHGRHRFQFHSIYDTPWQRASLRRSPLLFLALCVATPLMWLFNRLLPGQGNVMAFVVLKPRLPVDLHPWLRHHEGRVELDPTWIKRAYR